MRPLNLNEATNLIFFAFLYKFSNFSLNQFSSQLALASVMQKSLWLVPLVVGSFSSSIAAITVGCNFKMDEFGSVGYIYTCRVTNTQFSSNHTITGISGTHQSSKGNFDIKAIWIDGGGTMAFFPRGFADFFPNVFAIYLHSMAFDTLHGDELDEFGQRLQRFYLHHSNLTTISSRLFAATPNLVQVDFFNNKLRRVGRDLFTPLNVVQFKELIFINNPCIDQRSYAASESRALIDKLKVSCPYDDEFTTTNMPTTTTMTSSNQLSTTAAVPACFDGEIDNFVCGLKGHFDDVQLELKNTKNELQNQLVQSNKKFKATIRKMKDDMKRMSDELLRLTTHPCACK
jgi:hypothetical protein